MRTFVLTVCTTLVIASCGNGEITMNDYAAQVEELLTAMNSTVDALDADNAAQTPTVDDARAFWESKVAARRDFIDGLDSIEPPDEAVEMHAAATGIITRLAAADEAVADLVAAMETEAELSLLLTTPEFLATEAVDETAIAMCLGAQAEFDSTADREVFGDVPWIPSELQEVVLIHFGCTKAERGAG